MYILYNNNILVLSTQNVHIALFSSALCPDFIHKHQLIATIHKIFLTIKKI